MSIHKFFRIASCFALLLAFLLPQKNAYAQELNFVEIPLETLHDQKPIELQGLNSAQTLNLPLPDNWLPTEEIWLDIGIKASPLLDLRRSSLTISVNGLPLNSYYLSDVTDTQQQIHLPAKLFIQGNNSIAFTSTLYLPDDQQTNCQNWDDPARWLAIEPGGLLHLSFTKRDLQPDLSNFPRIFLEPFGKYLVHGADKPALIVLPENSTQDDLTSLSTLSYVLGNYAGADSDWHPEIVTQSQFDTATAANRNIVFIGNAPNELQDQISNEKDYVGLFPSPWGVGNAALIIGDQNRNDGFSPASVFSDRARSLLLQGNVAYVDHQAPAARQPFPNTFSFESLGYLDRTVRGIGQQSLIYSFYVPYDTEPVSAKLNLGLVHSPDLDIERSSFTVFLNGFSLAGIVPSDRSSSGEPISIGLPAKRLRRGTNFLRITSDLHLPRSSCERAIDTVWATIMGSSSLEMTYRNHVPIPSLKDFPLPFSDPAGSTFVIPDHYSSKDLDYVLRLSFSIGSASYELSRPPEVMTATAFRQEETIHPNAILVGLPSENLVTRSANDLLPQPFTMNGNSLQDGYGVYLPTTDKEASLGLMQVMRSPWVKDGTVLVLSGNDRQGLEWTWDAILNPALRNSFTGNVMVIGSASRSQSLGAGSVQESPQAFFQQIADASNIPVIGPILQRTGQAFLAPALLSIAVALLLVLGILWLLNVTRNKKLLQPVQKKDEEEENER